MVIYEMEETPSSLLPYLLDVVVEVYKGERSSDNLPHGSGRCTFKNGSTYEGTWSEGFLQGQGTYVWKDGVQFKGDFNRNEIQGKTLRKKAQASERARDSRANWRAHNAEGHSVWLTRDRSIRLLPARNKAPEPSFGRTATSTPAR